MKKFVQEWALPLTAGIGVIGISAVGSYLNQGNQTEAVDTKREADRAMDPAVAVLPALGM